MKTLEDWKDAYYEQAALHTESNGMLCQERDAALRRVKALEQALGCPPNCREDDHPGCGICMSPTDSIPTLPLRTPYAELTLRLLDASVDLFTKLQKEGEISNRDDAIVDPFRNAILDLDEALAKNPSPSGPFNEAPFCKDASGPVGLGPPDPHSEPWNPLAAPVGVALADALHENLDILHEAMIGLSIEYIASPRCEIVKGLLAHDGDARSYAASQPPLLGPDDLLPCDVSVPGGRVGKGCKVSTLLVRLKNQERYNAMDEFDALCATVAGVPCRFCFGRGNASGSCPECGKPEATVGEGLFTKADVEHLCAIAVAAGRSKPVIDKMVDRFLGWPLPKDFGPDAGITFKPSDHPHGWPVGTNLFTADQARQMILHILGEARPEGGALGKGADRG